MEAVIIVFYSQVADFSRSGSSDQETRGRGSKIEKNVNVL